MRNRSKGQEVRWVSRVEWGEEENEERQRSASGASASENDSATHLEIHLPQLIAPFDEESEADVEMEL